MLKKQTALKMLTFFSVVVIISTTLAIVPNQFDNFEDGTTQDWGSGANNPNPPTNISTGGLAGVNDNYLLATSTGSAGAGGKLVLINSAQWTGDYLAAGVQFVSMYIKNFGVTTLSLRIALQGPGGNFWSINPIVVDASSDWQPITFSIQPANLTGGINVNSTLSAVTQVRILHTVAGGFTGDPVAAQIGLDNITAASEPVLVEVDMVLLNNFSLKQNYPNPFNPSTKIRFHIPSNEKVKIEVFNTVGNKVSTLLNELKEEGSHEVQFEANNLASGVYFYKISAGNFVQTKKMLLIR